MSGERQGWPYEPVGGPPAAPPTAPRLEGPAPPPQKTEYPTVSRRAVVLLSVAGAVAVLLASVGVGDWWLRNREMQTLLDRVERAERAQLPAQESVGILLLLCQREAVTPALQGQLCDTVAIRQGAERTLPLLIESGDQVADSRLTNFHGSLRTFRDRYVEHNLAWRSWLEALAQDPTVDGFVAPDSIGTTFEQAAQAADKAVTPLPLRGNRERVAKIFESVR